MRLLIDGDILAYRSAAACDGRQYSITYTKGGQKITMYEKYKKDADAICKSLEKEGAQDVQLELTYEPEPFKNAKYLLDKQLKSIIAKCHSHYKEDSIDISIYLSRGGSFREREYPLYKSNRENMRRPEHLEALKDYMEEHYGAISGYGKWEADDLLAMEQRDDTVICSIDKDLLQVPGQHYNFVKDEHCTITEVEGNRNLYSQILTGDSTDGIPGIHGVGPKTAEKLLQGVQSPFLMYCVVLREYIDREESEEGESLETFQQRMVATVRMHARLLYLLRSPDDSWEAPANEEEA